MPAPFEPLASADALASQEARAALLGSTLAGLRSLCESGDSTQLGGRVLETITHPDWGGASRGWLLRLDPGADQLECERVAGNAGLPPLEFHRGEPGERLGEPDRVPLARLDQVTLAAWRERGVSWGPPGAGLPWSDAATIAAFAYRAGASVHLVIADYSSEESAAFYPAFATLASATQWAAQVLEQRETARRRERQRDALIEQSHAVAGNPHLIEGMRASLNAALQGSGAGAAALWRVQSDGTLRLEATAGGLAERESLARALEPLAHEVVAEGRARFLDRPGEEPALPAEVSERFGKLSCLPIPGAARVLGALALFDAAQAPHATFEPSDPALQCAMAERLAELFDQAERWEALRQAETQLAELRTRMRRRERLATLGEIAARLAREARHPLASIGAFSRRAHRELPENDPHREYLEVVIRETERLERMLGEPLELASAEPVTLKLESLNAVIQEVLPGVGERLVRRRVRLLKRLDPESPILLLDAVRMRQVLTNLLEHAVDAVPVGGRVRVESRLVRDHAVVEISYDARREPGGLLEPLYVSFRPMDGQPGGPALHVADQIVRRHGGEIRVRSDSEWGATVMLTLPVSENGDRRRTGPDRREAGRDRRRRAEDP